MIREHEYIRLKKLAAAWCDFGLEIKLIAAMEAFQVIERGDAAEVLRQAWIDRLNERQK